LMRGRPTGADVTDITFSVEPCILLISPIDSIGYHLYLGDIGNVVKDWRE
jgi:hypothetical protein